MKPTLKLLWDIEPKIGWVHVDFLLTWKDEFQCRGWALGGDNLIAELKKCFDDYAAWRKGNG